MPKGPLVYLMCAEVRQVDSTPLKMNKNQNGNSAPATSPARLDHNTRPVPAKVRELLQDQSNGLPVWIRPPKNGVEFYSGISRSKLYEMAGKGRIESRSIRQPGQVKGTRLFNLASILAFIEKCEQKHRRKKSWLRLQPYVRFFFRTMEFIYWFIRIFIKKHKHPRKGKWLRLLQCVPFIYRTMKFICWLISN